MNLPINPLTPEQQQKLMGQMYTLMGKQVQRYHKQRHMGNNSSVSMELARELMESIEYTIGQSGGIYGYANVEEALQRGQELLEEKVRKARSMLELVQATAPAWQTECRWEAIGYLRHYLDSYDHLHLAHRGPDELYYPILISTPEEIQGVDKALFYLNILWIENQIMDAVSEETLDALWDRLPAAVLNPCEQLLRNAVGKILIGTDIEPLTFQQEEYLQLVYALLGATEESLRASAKRLCCRLDLKNESAIMYVEAVAMQLAMWTGDNIRSCELDNLFL